MPSPKAISLYWSLLVLNSPHMEAVLHFWSCLSVFPGCFQTLISPFEKETKITFQERCAARRTAFWFLFSSPTNSWTSTCPLWPLLRTGWYFHSTVHTNSKISIVSGSVWFIDISLCANLCRFRACVYTVPDSCACTRIAFHLPSSCPAFNTMRSFCNSLSSNQDISFNSWSGIHVGVISKCVASLLAPFSRSFVNTSSISDTSACLLGTPLAVFSNCKNRSHTCALCLLSFN